MLNDSLSTKVTFASKVIDPSSRSFGIEIKLPTEQEYRPNMTAVLKIADYSKRNVIVVPVNAIQKSDEGDYVYVNENGVRQTQEYTGRINFRRLTEITSGLYQAAM